MSNRAIIFISFSTFIFKLLGGLGSEKTKSYKLIKIFCSCSCKKFHCHFFIQRITSELKMNENRKNKLFFNFQ